MKRGKPLKLYKAIALPVMEYASPVLVTAHDKCVKEFGKVQRYAMTKATGCMGSSSSEMLELLTNTVPIDIYLRCRQAQEVVRIAAKFDTDPVKQEFNEYLNNSGRSGRGNSTFDLLMSRFFEFKGKMDLEHIEKELQYSKDFMSLSRSRGKLELEEFSNSKDRQETNVLELLEEHKDETLVFTDGSSWGNPGPTGAGAVIYLNGYQSVPVTVKKAVSKYRALLYSNYFHGELVGLNMALEFLRDCGVIGRHVHIFTDCQPAIRAVFAPGTPSSKISFTLQTRQLAAEVEDKVPSLNVHWVPSHMGIKGNEMADQLAKAGAEEAFKMEIDEAEMMDSKEITQIK